MADGPTELASPLQAPVLRTAALQGPTELPVSAAGCSASTCVPEHLLYARHHAGHGEAELNHPDPALNGSTRGRHTMVGTTLLFRSHSIPRPLPAEQGS